MRSPGSSNRVIHIGPFNPDGTMPATTPTTTTDAEIEQGLTLSPRFDAQGLVAAIVTDAVTGDVLMFAWMNSQALRLTIDTGIAHFWSRSRSKIWKKGEESGNLLEIVEMRVRLRSRRSVAEGARQRRGRGVSHRRALLLLSQCARRRAGFNAPQARVRSFDHAPQHRNASQHSLISDVSFVFVTRGSNDFTNVLGRL